jgi:hypothetical protein
MLTTTIERLRGAAEERLALIAEEFGEAALLTRQCERVWLLAEGQAVLSLLNDDPRNARVVLEAALNVLEAAPEVARRAELSPAELSSLMRQAV